ncbi:hypothetical protein ABPG74_020957 [Tetrahymena malaccensis]
MELLKDGEKKVLQDYQQRLNQLNEKPEISTNNNSQVHTKYKYSSLLDNNNGRPTYYQQQYQQEYENLQKENRSNSIKLTSSNPLLASNNFDQFLSNSSKKRPLNGQTPSEYVNNCIQKQLDARKDFYNSQNNSLQQSFDRPNSKEKQDYINNGRFKVPSVNLFAQNFEGNLPKNVDLVNKSSNDLYAQEQNNYDLHLKSMQISQQLNQLIQRGVLAEKKREEKTQLFENVIQNSKLEYQQMLSLLEEVEDRNQNRASLNQTNINERDYSIVKGLQHTDKISDQLNTSKNQLSELDYQPVKVQQSKESIKDIQSVKSLAKIKSTDSKSKLKSKKDKGSPKSKQKKGKQGTLSIIKETESSQSSQKNIKSLNQIKSNQQQSQQASKILKDINPTSTANNSQKSKKNTISENTKTQSTTKLENQNININQITTVQNSGLINSEKPQQQILQESELIFRGFTAVMKSEQASYNNLAMDFIKQQLIQNKSFRDAALTFVKQYISSK